MRPALSLLLPVLVGVWMTYTLSAAPASRERIAEIAGMLPERPAAAGPHLSDRPAWEAFAKQAGDLLAEADRMLASPTPALPDDLYLVFSRTGTRSEYEKPYKERLHRLSVFVQAECATNSGKYLKAIHGELSAILAEKTWTMPAFDKKLENFSGQVRDVDLGVSMRGATVATAISWLGDRLSEDLRQSALTELRRRVFEPYLERVLSEQSPLCAWVKVRHNWNAACHAGLVVAALAVLPDRAERAEILAAAEHFLPEYLAGFSPDGFSGEGVIYWNYGFGHYVVLAETVLRATGGKLDFYRAGIVGKVAAFPEAFELAPGLYPAIADSPLNPTPHPWLRRLCQERLFSPRPGDAPASAPGDSLQLYEASVACFPLALLGKPGAMLKDTTSPLRGWFPDAGVLVSRPAPGAAPALAAAIIGGNNSDNHNHNDIGQFVVALGGRMLVADPGGESYTAVTFSSRRYESEMLNSLGHSVPIVAGQLQRSGPPAAARVIHSDFRPSQDSLTLDIASAYDVPSLAELTRTFVFTREGSGSVEITDRFRFTSPESFESAIITCGSIAKKTADSVIIVEGNSAIRVQFLAKSSLLEIDQRPLRTTKATPPMRIWAKLKSPVSEGEITCRITVADHGSY